VHRRRKGKLSGSQCLKDDLEAKRLLKGPGEQSITTIKHGKLLRTAAKRTRVSHLRKRGKTLGKVPKTSSKNEPNSGGKRKKRT